MRTARQFFMAGAMAAALLMTPVGLTFTMDGAAHAATIKGHPFSDAPGAATGKECRGYAGAANGLNGRNDPGDKELADAIVEAGRARGCVFMQ